MRKYESLVMEILNSSEEHLTAEEIYEEGKKRTGKKLVLATVYNNLGALCREKAIRRIPSNGDGKDRYDKTFVPHGHLVCTVCNGMKDFFSADIGKVIKRASGVKPTSYDLNVYYVCDKCKTEE